jgi:hypothetical protein
MKSAETPTLSRTLVAGLATAALSVSVAGTASAATDTTEPGHTMSTSAGSTTDNTLRITQRDYEFQVDGTLTAGSVSIAVENLGAEFHEIAMARLLDGHTVEEVRAALGAATEEEDPLQGLVEEDSVIDELGGAAAPGTAYTMSGDGIEAGEYVLICFIPNAEGVPHFQLGMVSGFTVAEGDATAAPATDVTYTMSDEGLDGPSELAAGETAIEFVNESAANRELTLFKVKEGSTLDDVSAFFAAADEGPPEFAGGPLEFLVFMFDGASDRTMTVNLTAGQWVLQTPDPEQPFEGDPTQDPHTLLVTVA